MPLSKPDVAAAAITSAMARRKTEAAPTRKLDKFFGDDGSDDDKDPFERARQFGTQYRKEETKAAEKAAEAKAAKSVAAPANAGAKKRGLFNETDEEEDVGAFKPPMRNTIAVT